MVFLFLILPFLIYLTMLKMPDTIISDTSCFIILSNIGELDLLQKLYGTVTTTLIVANEFGVQLPEWVIVKAAVNQHYEHILALQVDIGEASAIALAIESEQCVLIVDDYKARKLAINLGLKITGTLGIIIKAKIKGIIPSIKPIIDKIRDTDFRLSDEIIQQAYLQAGENLL